MARRSPLRNAFDRAERLVGEPLEAGVNTDLFLDLMAFAVRAGATLNAISEGLSAGMLHRFNLPSHSDVVELRNEVLRLETRLMELTDAMARRTRRPDRPARSAARSRNA